HSQDRRLPWCGDGVGRQPSSGGHKAPNHRPVADGFSLWSERFDREMQDVFAIQDDITRAIMAALKLRLAGHSDQPVFKLQTTNAEAYELYLKGRFFWNQRGIGLRKALHYFELALIEDPDYALAMSGLAFG